MNIKSIQITAVAIFCLNGSVMAATEAPDGATAYIISPTDGAIVSNPVTVLFGIRGMGVAPAGIARCGYPRGATFHRRCRRRRASHPRSSRRP